MTSESRRMTDALQKKRLVGAYDHRTVHHEKTYVAAEAPLQPPMGSGQSSNHGGVVFGE